MNIIWRGHSCFQITVQNKKQGQINIVIDPFDEKLGIRVPKLEADVLLITHQHYDHNNIKAVKGNPFLIQGPGEYEIKKISIHGISSFHDDNQGKERGENTIYTIKNNGIQLCHLGDLGQKELTEEQVEKIGQIDILFIPVGGTYTIGSQEALKVINQIEPKIVIPMHYHLPNIKIKLDNLNNFLKAIGEKSIEPLDKLSIKSKDLEEQEKMKVIVLKP
ncbi:MBL fold metallo-hydrolase [Candidatus Parcubacteria bacterium]|nr:MBL fold metallo-hydrolase [Candidatus Parcubacteria bacterium]